MSPAFLQILCPDIKMADKYKEEQEEENKVFHIAMICRFFQQRNEEISFRMYGRYRFGRGLHKEKNFC
ncbi:MAG: hypothetical protein LKE40_09550 [Spirochaetia bacterium]|nr:hypothetical protein [Spirochaetia bacterium]